MPHGTERAEEKAILLSASFDSNLARHKQSHFFGQLSASSKLLWHREFESAPLRRAVYSNRHPRDDERLRQRRCWQLPVEAYGIASVRVIVSIAGSRNSGLTGAKPKPQLPITIEVTPCQLEIVQ